MQHEEGPDFPADAKPAQTVLEGHGGSQSWLWTIHTDFLEFLSFPMPGIPWEGTDGHTTAL